MQIRISKRTFSTGTIFCLRQGAGVGFYASRKRPFLTGTKWLKLGPNCPSSKRPFLTGPKVLVLVRVGSDLFGFVTFSFRTGRKAGVEFVRVANF